MKQKNYFSYKFETTLNTWFNTRSTKCCDFTQLFRDLNIFLSARSTKNFHIPRWLVERELTIVVDREHFDRCVHRLPMRIYLNRNMSIKLPNSIDEHRYFSSIFPRQSKAMAIFIDNKRIVPVRFLQMNKIVLQGVFNLINHVRIVDIQ